MNPKPHPFLFLTLSLLLLSPSHSQTLDSQSFISFLISSSGLHFLKDLLVTKAISSLTPLQLPQIEQTQKISFLGDVHVVLSKITINKIRVSESYIEPGDSGVVIVVSGVTANLSLSWYYVYSAGWFLPIKISDHGQALVEVKGMQVGLALGLENNEGTLKLSLLECGCYVEDISIKLQGGASWLYQGLIDAFVGQIQSTVENTVSEKLIEGIRKLDEFLQSLPKRIPIDDIASLNVTFVNDPELSSSSIGFEINGLFTPRDKILNFDFYKKDLLTLSCYDSLKMLGIAIDEAVFHSASTLYFNAGYLQWIVDKIPDQALLNTAGWRFIIPQLYKKYPNDDMNLNVSFASAPVLRISENNIDTNVDVDLIIDVIKGGDVIPVACILLEIGASGSVKIVGNNMGGNVKLNDFKMSLKWSRIGNLHMFLIQPVIRTIVETVFLPYTNARLGKGFPLPIIHGFTLQEAQISLLDSSIVLCSDVLYTD